MFHYWTLPRRFVPALDTLLTTLKPFGGCFGTHSLILRTHEFQLSHVTENCLCFTIGRFHVVLCLHLAHFWQLLGHWGLFWDTFWPVWATLGRSGTLLSWSWVTPGSKKSRRRTPTLGPGSPYLIIGHNNKDK